jgi:hypothetical protein
LGRTQRLNGDTLIRKATVLFAALAALLVAPSAEAEEAVAKLPALAANISETSVSGISSGAYMAGQFQIAHSRIVAGAAIIAGGPYGCAESAFADVMSGPGLAFLNLSKAVNGCMLNALALWGIPDVELLVEKTKKLADTGRIDPLSSLLDDRVYLFSGENDHTVVPAIVKSAYEYYRRLGVPESNLTFVFNMPAGHAFVTDDGGLSCELTSKPYVVDCDYDQAGEVLKRIYGSLSSRAPQPAGVFQEFDQRPFQEGFSNHGMEKRGVVYIPPSCAADTACRVHIAYHGCAQNRATAGDAFIRESGYANWADANAFIILFPEAAASPVNPQGCWDWWGYTSDHYLTREAPQIEIVYRMLQQLGKPRP